MRNVLAKIPARRSTDPIERVHKGIKRRINGVGVFPNDAALLQLVTAVIAEAHDE